MDRGENPLMICAFPFHKTDPSMCDTEHHPHFISTQYSNADTSNKSFGAAIVLLKQIWNFATEKILGKHSH